MINFIKDLLNFLRYKKNETNYSTGFFCENNFIFQYLEPFITKKVIKKEIAIISFEKIDEKILSKKNVFVFKTNFFRQLIFLTLNLKYLYSSTPDLGKTIFSKSKFNKCKYIYLQHSPVSLTMIYNEGAFNNFDAIQVISKFQLNEMIEIKEKYNLNIKIFKSQYLFVKRKHKDINNKKDHDLLIAPSWNSSFFKLNCHKILKDYLEKNNISYKIRPHPMSYIKGEISKTELKSLGMLIDDSVNINFNKYNFFISDWSGLFIEYALIFKRTSYLINTPKKIANKNYENFQSIPVEISLRNILSNTYEVGQIKNLIDNIRELKNSNNFKEDANIKKILEENFY